jgi:zinc protease
MHGCLLDPLEFASEKNVVLEELAMGEDEPWRPLYQVAEGTMFQTHPYHHPVIGYREELERLTAQQMRDYYRRNYGPNRAFLVVVGAIDKQRTARRIEQLFGPLARCDDRATAIREPQPLGERRAVMRTPHSVTRMCIGFMTCRMGERDDYALDVIAHDLGNSKNSRLYRRLVLRDELVTEINVINETRQEPGALFVMCELRPGSDPARVEAVVREEIARQIEQGVAKRDLQRILAQIRASFLFQDEAVLDMAMKLARFEASTPDGFRTLANVLPTYDSLTQRELRTVAARDLDFRRAAIVWAVPAAPARPATRARKVSRKRPAKATAVKRRRGSRA